MSADILREPGTVREVSYGQLRFKGRTPAHRTAQERAASAAVSQQQGAEGADFSSGVPSGFVRQDGLARTDRDETSWLRNP